MLALHLRRQGLIGNSLHLYLALLRVWPGLFARIAVRGLLCCKHLHCRLHDPFVSSKRQWTHDGRVPGKWASIQVLMIRNGQQGTQQPLSLDMNNAVRQCCCSYQKHPYVERQIICTEILACQDHMQSLQSYYNKTICSTFALLSLRPFFLSMLLHEPQTAFAALASSLHRVMLLAMPCRERL